MRDRLRMNLLHYTRGAFATLPPMEAPWILDIGCGSGIPTTELARLSRGRVVGLDKDVRSLGRTRQRVGREGLTGRVGIIRGSLLFLPFRPESFQILWSEGSVKVIGLDRALKEWRCFLSSSGYLVVHESTSLMTSPDFPEFGYRLRQRFDIPGEVWMERYYHPLERELEIGPPSLGDDVEELYREIEWMRENPHDLGSTYLVLQKFDL